MAAAVETRATDPRAMAVATIAISGAIRRGADAKATAVTRRVAQTDRRAATDRGELSFVVSAM
jgi:hypothetical protein